MMIKIQKETTSRSEIVFTYCNEEHAEGMWFKDEQEFELFVTHLNFMVKNGACGIEFKM